MSMKTSDSQYAECLYFTSSALARKVEKMANECWKQVDLSPSHAYLLMAVLEEPGMQPGNLAEQLQLTPSTITRLIEKLEEKKTGHTHYGGKTHQCVPHSQSKRPATGTEELCA